MTLESPREPSRLRLTLWLGALACVLMAVAVIATEPSLRQNLKASYRYESAQQLDLAHSSTLTYLFSIAALGVIAFGLFALFARRISGSPMIWWLALILFLLATAVAIYNLTQPFPLLSGLAGLLPSLLGMLALVQLGRSVTGRVATKQ